MLAPGAELTPAPDVPALFAALAGGARVVVPLENSVAGTVLATLVALAALPAPVGVGGECVLPVRFGLYRRADDVAPLERVVSHAMSLAQCAPWLARRGVAVEEAGNNGAALARVAGGAEPGLGAVGPAEETVAGLIEAERDLQGRAPFTTRFLLLTPEPPRRPGRALAAATSPGGRVLGMAGGVLVAEVDGGAAGRPLASWPE